MVLVKVEVVVQKSLLLPARTTGRRQAPTRVKKRMIAGENERI